MNTAQEKLQIAMNYAMENRPKVGGFPFLAECLRQAGVEHTIWSLPAAQSIYIMKNNTIVNQGTPLVLGMTTVPLFNEDMLVTALRTDQSGNSTFPEFLVSAWNAGVLKYNVDFNTRVVTYHGAEGERYEESYPEVQIDNIPFK